MTSRFFAFSVGSRTASISSSLTVLAALSTWLVLRLEPGLGYLPAIAITFAVTMPVVLAASYVYARVIDEPSTFLADRLAIRSMAFVAAVRAPRLWQSRSNEL